MSNKTAHSPYAEMSYMAWMEVSLSVKVRDFFQSAPAAAIALYAWFQAVSKVLQGWDESACRALSSEQAFPSREWRDRTDVRAKLLGHGCRT